MTSIALHRGAVQLRVGLHRGDQLGDPAGRLLDLARAASAVDSVLATHSRPGSSAAPVEHARPPARTRRRRRRRAASGGAISQSCVDAVVGQPVDSVVLAVGHAPAGRRRRPRLDLAPQRVERDELRGRDRPVGEPAERATAASAQALLERVDRAGRGRGRVVDLVREPGGQRAERDQRLALPGRRLDACAPCGRAPRSGGRRTGTRRSTSSRSALGRHPEHPPGARRRGRSRGRRRARPRRGSRRPTDRARPSRRRTVSSRPTCRTRSSAPSTQHPPEVGGLALVEQLVARLERAPPSPAATQLAPAGRR